VCVRGRVAVLHAHLLSERRKQATSGRIHARQRARDESLVRRSSRPPRPDNSRPLRWSFPPPLPPWPTESTHFGGGEMGLVRRRRPPDAHPPLTWPRLHVGSSLSPTMRGRRHSAVSLVCASSGAGAHRSRKVRRTASCQSRGLSPCRPSDPRHRHRHRHAGGGPPSRLRKTY
jgi:hypothetical protein